MSQSPSAVGNMPTLFLAVPFFTGSRRLKFPSIPKRNSFAKPGTWRKLVFIETHILYLYRQTDVSTFNLVYFYLKLSFLRSDIAWNLYSFLPTSWSYIYIYIYVCVCVRERERERRASSVDMVTCYGLDGRGSIPGSGKIILFSTACRLAPKPTQPPILRERGVLSPEVKQLGRETGNLSPSSAKVKNGPQYVFTA
jgi:hypothetical protein